MHSALRTLTLTTTFALALATAGARAQSYVPGGEEDLPRVLYPDGQTSINDRCPVRLAKLNLRMDPVHVNGKPRNPLNYIFD